MNKYQEALVNTKQKLAMHNHDLVGRHTTKKNREPQFYFDMLTNDTDISRLQELVDRATPMKPIITHLLKMNGECRKCHHMNANIMNFCWYCGQALDWSDSYEQTR